MNEDYHVSNNMEPQYPDNENITIDALVLSNLLRSAADSLQAGHANGLGYICIKDGMTLRDFMRFCLGADAIGDPGDDAPI